MRSTVWEVKKKLQAERTDGGSQMSVNLWGGILRSLVDYETGSRAGSGRDEGTVEIIESANDLGRITNNKSV